MKYRVLCLSAVCAALVVCHVPVVAGPVSDSIEELALPVLPKDMTNPVDRADYLLAHFWDAMDFADSSRVRDRDFMEQNLVNFFSVMPHASADGRQAAVGNLMQMASVNVDAYKLIMELAEHYLYEPGSPMRDEEMFIPFLNVAVDSPVLTESERIRPRYLLDEALRNRVGAMSTDFDMKLRGGSTVGMHKFTSGKPALLMFYDPECDHCAETIEILRTDNTLNRLLGEGRINVLAVYPFGEEYVWLNDPMVKIPVGWTDAFADMSEVDLYSFPEMPVLYLLDASGRVLLKDATVDKITEGIRGLLSGK